LAYSIKFIDELILSKFQLDADLRVDTHRTTGSFENIENASMVNMGCDHYSASVFTGISL